MSARAPAHCPAEAHSPRPFSRRLREAPHPSAASSVSGSLPPRGLRTNLGSPQIPWRSSQEPVSLFPRASVRER